MCPISEQSNGGAYHSIIANSLSYRRLRMANESSLIKILGENDEKLRAKAIAMAEQGDLAGLESLFSFGLRIDAYRGLFGFTCLHHACNRGHVAVVSELLKHGVSINACNESGETPLHLACYSGQLNVVELLIDKGALLELANGDGETCLFYAAKRNMPAVTRLLLQRGANPESVDRFGDRAIDHSADERVRREFQHKYAPEAAGGLGHAALLLVFKYLSAREVCRGACVSTRWHRASESEQIWTALGIRRWEFALKSTLGLPPAPAQSFSRRSSKDSSGKK